MITIIADLLTFGGKKSSCTYCLNSPALNIGDHFLQERGTVMSKVKRSRFLWRFPKSLDPPLVPSCHCIKKCNHASVCLQSPRNTAGRFLTMQTLGLPHASYKRLGIEYYQSGTHTFMDTHLLGIGSSFCLIAKYSNGNHNDHYGNADC